MDALKWNGQSFCKLCLIFITTLERTNVCTKYDKFLWDMHLWISYPIAAV